MSSAVFCVTSSDLVVSSRLFCIVSSSDTCNIEMYVSNQTEPVLHKICVQNVSLLYRGSYMSARVLLNLLNELG